MENITKDLKEKALNNQDKVIKVKAGYYIVSHDGILYTIEHTNNKWEVSDNDNYNKTFNTLKESLEDIISIPENPYTNKKVSILWEKALDNFPHDLSYTSVSMGTPPDELDSESNDIEYSEEYTFTAGMLFDDTLIAGGWIEIRYDKTYDKQPYITAFFGVSRNGNFHDEDSKVLGDCEAAQTQFDLDTLTWDDIVISSM